MQKRNKVLAGVLTGALVLSAGPMALAATASGADGLMIEVHNDPEHALCDGPQSLRPDRFAGMMEKVRAIQPYADRSFSSAVAFS